MHILLDTSNVRMIVVCPESPASGIRGRATAITRLASATRKRRNGRCFLSQEDRGMASSISDRLEYRTAKRCRLRSIPIYTATSRGMHPSRRRKSGHSQSTTCLVYKRKSRQSSHSWRLEGNNKKIVEQ
jgi:hypothetical protein